MSKKKRADAGPINAFGALSASGMRSLATGELVAMVLGAGCPSDVSGLLKTGLKGLARMSVSSLARAAGVDEKKAARMHAALELGRRWAEEKRPTKRLRCGRDVYDHYRGLLQDLKQERLTCALLDHKYGLVGDEVVSTGGTASTQMRLVDALKGTACQSAAAVAFVHNHPSGDASPSGKDRQLTDRLAKAARQLGVKLVDHVIVGDDCYYSFFEAGAL